MATDRSSVHIIPRHSLLLSLFIVAVVVRSTATTEDEQEMTLPASTQNSTFQTNALGLHPKDPSGGTADCNTSPAVKSRWRHTKAESTHAHQEQSRLRGTPPPRWRDRDFGFSAHEVPSGPNPISN